MPRFLNLDFFIFTKLHKFIIHLKNNNNSSVSYYQFFDVLQDILKWQNPEAIIQQSVLTAAYSLSIIYKL